MVRWGGETKERCEKKEWNKDHLKNIRMPVLWKKGGKIKEKW